MLSPGLLRDLLDLSTRKAPARDASERVVRERGPDRVGRDRAVAEVEQILHGDAGVRSTLTGARAELGGNERGVREDAALLTIVFVILEHPHAAALGVLDLAELDAVAPVYLEALRGLRLSRRHRGRVRVAEARRQDQVGQTVDRVAVLIDLAPAVAVAQRGPSARNRRSRASRRGRAASYTRPCARRPGRSSW